MNILSETYVLINKIIESSINQTFIQKNGTRLLDYDMTKMPQEKHILYKPLNNEELSKLRNAYKLKFPESLNELFSLTNGADLFSYQRKIGNFIIPGFQLILFGAPRTNNRDVDNLEPFNISVEDLKKPDGCPQNWIKFGAINRINDNYEMELYIDTTTSMDKVYALERSKFIEVEQWNSFTEFLKNSLIKLT